MFRFFMEICRPMASRLPINPNEIFFATAENFESYALKIFLFQHQANSIYRRYCDLLQVNPHTIDNIEKIPFLPIGCFKTEQVSSTVFEAQAIFGSSGTSGEIPSQHFVKDISIYIKSFTAAFNLMYGDITHYCILGLLPSYLERKNASLIYMVEHLIKISRHPASGFYLDDLAGLQKVLEKNESNGQPTLLIGVTYALLDFASAYPLPLKNTIIMETGGMKGRKKEITRLQVHNHLKRQFNLATIHSEYGMTELLSQAYSKKDGLFTCPPWMKVLKREIDDPFAISAESDTAGLANIIDLANIYSCAFIATEDVVRLHPNGIFEVLGRSDNSELRGCSLMI